MSEENEEIISELVSRVSYLEARVMHLDTVYFQANTENSKYKKELSKTMSTRITNKIFAIKIIKTLLLITRNKRVKK